MVSLFSFYFWLFSLFHWAWKIAKSKKKIEWGLWKGQKLDSFWLRAIVHSYKRNYSWILWIFENGDPYQGRRWPAFDTSSLILSQNLRHSKIILPDPCLFSHSSTRLFPSSDLNDDGAASLLAQMEALTCRKKFSTGAYSGTYGGRKMVLTLFSLMNSDTAPALCTALLSIMIAICLRLIFSLFFRYENSSTKYLRKSSLLTVLPNTIVNDSPLEIMPVINQTESLNLVLQMIPFSPLSIQEYFCFVFLLITASSICSPR